MTLQARQLGTALMQNMAALQDAEARGDWPTANLIRQAIVKLQKKTKATELSETVDLVAALRATGDLQDAAKADVLEMKTLSPSGAVVAQGIKAGFSPAQTTQLIRDPVGASAMAKIVSSLSNGINDYTKMKLTPAELAAMDRVRRPPANVAKTNTADISALLSSRTGTATQPPAVGQSPIQFSIPQGAQENSAPFRTPVVGGSDVNSPTNPAYPQSKAEYDALPPEAYWIDIRSGTEVVKQKPKK